MYAPDHRGAPSGSNALGPHKKHCHMVSFEGGAIATLRRDTISLVSGPHRSCTGVRHRLGVQQPESLEGRNEQNTFQLTCTEQLVSTHWQGPHCCLQTGQVRGLPLAFILAIMMNPIKMGLESAGAFCLPLHGKQDISSFPLTPVDMDTSCMGTSLWRKLRGLLGHFEQRENYLSLPHIKRVVLGLAKVWPTGWE